MLHEKPQTKKEQQETLWCHIWQIFTGGHEKIGKAFRNYHLARRRYIVSRASTHFGKDKHEPAPLLGRTLLDVGCGTSKLAEEMTFRGAEVTAIDVDVDAIEYAKEQAQHSGAIVNFVQGGPEELLQKGEKFDIILCMDIFEYINHTSKLLSSIHSLLKDDGIVLFSSNNRTPNSLFWHILIAEVWCRWIPKGTYRFRRFRSTKKLHGKFADKGLDIQEIKGVRFGLKSLKWKRTKTEHIRYLGYAVKKSA